MNGAIRLMIVREDESGNEGRLRNAMANVRRILYAEKVAGYADVSVESAEYNLKVFNIELGGSSVSQDGVHDT